VLEPPRPLPPFAEPEPLTVDDVRQHLRTLQQSAW
jgi:hypothetical protein